MRGVLVPIVLVGVLLQIVRPATGAAGDGPHVAIVGIRMAGPHSLRIEVATSGLDTEEAETPAVALTVWLDGVPAHATLPLIRMPARFPMDLDLPAGVVRVGGIPVGAFRPIRPFEENLRFPVEVTVSRGGRTATARRMGTILLPTVIAPGNFNEEKAPDQGVLAALGRHGYEVEGGYPTLAWCAYPSEKVTPETGAFALAACARRVIFPATYAVKINVIGYSLGGLLARWAVAHDTDGWATLVSRLVLVAVPNEGSVMAYLVRHVPFFLPFSSFGHSAAAQFMAPTFPFWRADPSQPWGAPHDGGNATLADLNTRPIPNTVRVYIFYGSHDPRRPAGPVTSVGITKGELSFAPGDGIVLADSALGLPINGGSGVGVLADRTVMRVDLGSVYHTALLAAGAERIAGALQDHFSATVDEAAGTP